MTQVRVDDGCRAARRHAAAVRHACRSALRLLLCAPVCLTGCLPAWPTDFENQPVDPTGYQIEDLPVVITASYARGDDVYLGLDTGEIRRARDSQLSEPWADVGQPLGVGPRLLFASRTGVLFTSADGHPLCRSDDAGTTWQPCLDTSVWRMDEDDQGNLFAGNYTKDGIHHATLYKSCDVGQTWTAAFSDPANDHIHTVRWDERSKRLYIAFGDGRQRGQAFSADHGATFTILGRSPVEGHTDVGFTRDYILWGTDNGSGQVLRVSRATGEMEIATGWSQYIWFVVTDGEQQVYAGTMPSQPGGGERAALLASADQGRTWQKLIDTAQSTAPYAHGFFAESRELSAGGWLYCTGYDESGPRSYRVRRAPAAAE